MAEDKKETPPAPTIDWKAAEATLKTLEDKVMEYNGREGYNPHLWLRKKGLADVRKRLNAGVKNKEDIDTILKTKFEEPTVNVKGKTKLG